MSDTVDERAAMREFLLLASYCGGDKGKHCTNGKPCLECLLMCNVFLITDRDPVYIRQLGKVTK